MPAHAHATIRALHTSEVSSARRLAWAEADRGGSPAASKVRQKVVPAI